MSEIHKLINSICNQEELPDQWKESIIAPIYKKDDKTDCSNYNGRSEIHLFLDEFPHTGVACL
jgi:hypothetical protein